MKCPKCHKIYTNPIEIEFIRESGECLMCDHVYGEMILEQSDQANERFNENNL